MSPNVQHAQLVVLRLILIVLVGGAGAFGAVKLRDHNRHESACKAYILDDGPPAKGCG